MTDTRETVRAEGVMCAAFYGNVGANDPQDCDWPFCGCDPHATIVLNALEECGVLAPPPAPPSSASAESELRGLLDRLVGAYNRTATAPTTALRAAGHAAALKHAVTDYRALKQRKGWT